MLRIRYRNARQTTYNRRVALAAALVRRSRPFLCAYLATRKKAAKVSLDGSCRCVCVEVLCRAVLERSPVLALIWTHATFNEAGGCVASVSGQRSPILMTCDWRQCSSSQLCCPIR
jgi:hypothetical protein